MKETTILERKINYKTVVITEVTKELQFFAQNVETGNVFYLNLFC